MSPATYEELTPLTRDEAERALASKDPGEVARAILAAALSVDDVAWLSTKLAHLVKHASPEVRAAAARACGHVARLHPGDPARTKHLRALLEPLLLEPSTKAAARDALDDVDMFAR